MHDKAFRAMHRHAQVGAAYVVDGVVVIKQTNEGANGATGVVVFGLAQKQGASAFKVTQVDIVAHGCPHHLAF